MTRRSLKHLDELDAVEEKERLEKERVKAAKSLSNLVAFFDPNTFSGFNSENLF
jgi:hypothetical protein